MKRIAILVVFSAASMLAMGSAFASPPPTFDSCESAFNYGHNTSEWFVKAALTRANCVREKMDAAEEAAYNSMKKQKIPPHNTDELMVCFYGGLYSGYISGLEHEYAECPEETLGIRSIALAAASVFSAMHFWLDSVENEEIDQVFDGIHEAAPEEQNACETTILNKVQNSGGLVELLALVCSND